MTKKNEEPRQGRASKEAESIEVGSVQWPSRLIFYLQHQHPIWAPVQAHAAPFLTKSHASYL